MRSGLMTLLLASSAATTNGAPVVSSGATKKNVLFIVVDNLRPALGAYGQPHVISPNIDALAKDSTLFSRAYCQEAWCSPSRNSFLTGRRPDTTQAWNFRTSFRNAPGGSTWTTLPGHFLKQGYYAAASGKVFHPNLPTNGDFPQSWSVPAVVQAKDECADATGNISNTTMSCSFAPGDGVADADSECADLVLTHLDTWQGNVSKTSPFFLAAGFQSCRLSWSYPEAVLSRYPAAHAIPITAPELQRSPVDSSLDLEWFRPTEIDWYTDVEAQHAEPVPVAMQHQLRLAYYCAVTHVDDQVGRLLGALRAKALYDDTVIVFTADHGQNLGELNMWSMMNLLETSLRVPLIIKPAGHDSAGIVPVYSHPVELVDLYPTVTALAHLPPAHGQALAGSDLSHAMHTGKTLKPAGGAYSQITRCHNCTTAYEQDEHSYQMGCTEDAVDGRRWTVPCAMTPAASFDYMGMSVRTDSWRYTIWCKWQPTLAVDWAQCRLPELYNYTADRALYDVDVAAYYKNVANAPVTASVQSQLHALLRKGFE